MTSAAAQTAQTVTDGQPEVILRIMLTANQAIDDFEGECRRLRWSERSIPTYLRTLYEFADRLPRDSDVSKITEDDVRRYLATKAHLAAGTVSQHEAHLSSWFRLLYEQRKITRNPMDRIARTKRTPAEDLDVVSLDTDAVRKLIVAANAGTWAERNAIHILAHLGPRRRAIATLRLSDYNRKTGHIRFKEKGGKIIWKPVPDELAWTLEASIADGAILEPPHDYLVPPEGYLIRKGDRDDRVIWRLVKKVADRAGVPAHVHALRAAFACFYLEQNPDDIVGLKDLLGHRSLQTTLIYLRRRNKQTGMERVRGLSWGVAAAGDGAPVGLSQIAVEAFHESSMMGAGGFEPPFPEGLGPVRDADQLPVDLLSRAAEVSEPPMSGLADSKEGE